MLIAHGHAYVNAYADYHADADAHADAGLHWDHHWGVRADEHLQPHRGIFQNCCILWHNELTPKFQKKNFIKLSDISSFQGKRVGVSVL